MPFNPASSHSFNPRAKGDEAPGDTAEAKKILTVKEQYADGRYADFVEAKRNAPFYKCYLHYTLMKHIEDGYENRILHVTNLTKNVNKGILEEIFGNYGKVKDVELGIDETVKLPLGYAFVEMEDKDGAEKALKSMDSGQIDGNKIRVKYKLVANSRRSSGRLPRSPSRRESSSSLPALGIQVKEVLDIGCGNGCLSHLILGRWPKASVTALDQSPAMLHRAEELVKRRRVEKSLGFELERLHFVLADIKTFKPKKNRSYDLVMSGLVLCHMHTRSELVNFFNKAFELLGPGGITTHIVPPLAEKAANIPKVLRAEIPMEGDNTKPVVLFDTMWSKQDYMTAASMAGFIDVKIEEAVVSPEGVKELGTKFWSELLDKKLGRYAIIRARRPLDLKPRSDKGKGKL
eukprot:jgi/Bigna1/89292/estExt_fgenesh1_pg.C_460129